ncbi:hypothetical protein BMI86_10300 [Thioclava sp. DLFJ5-1]|uniref:hypothetical protein n=1 Tax=Thioclava sp. DLFJ5-1 TaxID=1915314 RepID=UPI00099654B8|nr:hypothetical protein [Thioclava sp. DLFJ5-1]OOY20888.1 hypothetical protein BMI86_10300 [Thioclava sp. DLFJ5-1]
MTIPAILQEKLYVLLGERGDKTRHAVRQSELTAAVNGAVTNARGKALIDARKAAADAKSIYGSTQFSVSNTQVLATNIKSAPATLVSETVSGFATGGFQATFFCTIDTIPVPANVFGAIELRINGSLLARQLFGIEPASGVTHYKLPVSLTGVYNGTDEAPTIEVLAYSVDPDDDTIASDTFYVLGARLSIAGAS